MSTSRIEAFSDGVIAIIITIMVLELKAPQETTLAALREIVPIFLSYVLSFVVVAIMWINHHQTLHMAKQITGQLLWSNILLLFWMSLIPFATVYMGEHYDDSLPVALYGTVLTLAVVAFTLFRAVLKKQNLHDVELTRQNQRIQRKNIISNVLYAASIPLAFISVYFSFFIFVLIPILYFLPEQKLLEHTTASTNV